MFTHTPEKSIQIYISLGSNSGDAMNNLKIALQEIQEYTKGSIGAISSIYKTEPQGDKDQNWFYNQLIRFDFVDVAEYKLDRNPNKTQDKNLDKNKTKPCPLSKIESEAHLLLNFLLNIEEKMGRKRDPLRRFGPRIIDLDIILFGTHCINSEKLSIPHPRFLERAFILIPLQEIAPSIIIPNKTNIKDALNNLSFTVDGDKIYQ